MDLPARAPTYLIPRTPYTIAILPDTQYLCRIGDEDWPDRMVQYIVDEKARYDADPDTGRNIIGIVGVGDVTNDIGLSIGCGSTLIARFKTQFEDIAFAAGMPVAPTIGNHDLWPTNDITIAGADLWRTYFGSSWWIDNGQTYFNGCATLADGTRYGADTNCSFSFPTGNGNEKIHIITTEWHTTAVTPASDTLTAARDWVVNTILTYPDQPALISTHDNLHTNWIMNDDPETWACGKPGVSNYWTSVLLSVPQFFGLISGHDINGQGGIYDSEAHNGSEDDVNWSCYLTGINNFGHGYFEEFRDYQLMESQPAQAGGNGDGLIWFMEIDEDAGTVRSRSCSPDTILDYCRTAFRETQTLTNINFSVRPALTAPDIPVLSPFATLLFGNSILALGIITIVKGSLSLATRTSTRSAGTTSRRALPPSKLPSMPAGRSSNQKSPTKHQQDNRDSYPRNHRGK